MEDLADLLGGEEEEPLGDFYKEDIEDLHEPEVADNAFIVAT